MNSNLSVIGIGALLFGCCTLSIAADFVPVSDATLKNPDDGDWLMWRRTWNSWGYSPLKQIDKKNVAQLKLVWQRPLHEGIQEGTPLVYRGTMYFPNPSDVIQAMNAATGELMWEYKRPVPDDINQYLAFPMINRNVAIYQNLIIGSSMDDMIYALNAESGEVMWETQVLDYKVHPAQQTSGPIVANGKVLSGRGCEANDGPEACVLTAHDALTGKELWRTSTIEKFTSDDDSWGGYPYEQRSHIGSWLVPSFDPELNMVYFGTSVTSPAPKFLLRGNDKKYLYHNSTLALNADDGNIVWYYQHLVDHWDLDHTFERLLVETKVAPDADSVAWINPAIKTDQKRKVVTGIPGKTGIVYTLDARTGEFLWAKPTVYQNVVDSIDGKSGEVNPNVDTVFEKMGDKATICPNIDGGKNWPAGAYSPLGNVMFYPLQNACMDVEVVIDKPTLDSAYGITRVNAMAPDEKNLGTIYAISVESGKTMWKYQQRASVTSLVATGSGLLFAGDSNGFFRALDQSSGEVLWEYNVGSQVTGYPITYAVDGKQYVAVSTGTSVTTGFHLALTPELQPKKENILFVFALPD